MIAKESLYFVIPLFAVSLIFFLASLSCLACIFVLLIFLMLFFFRDPERNTPGEDGIIVSPADGKIMSIEKMGYPEKKGSFRRVSIFMSPLDVHVNRSPVDGKVISLKRRGGGHIPAYKRESVENEKAIIELESKGERFIVEMIAGILARRIKTYISPGDSLKKGERIGIIMFGSRVDLYFSPDFEIEVKEGDKIKAGESILGRRKI